MLQVSASTAGRMTQVKKSSSMKFPNPHPPEGLTGDDPAQLLPSGCAAFQGHEGQQAGEQGQVGMAQEQRLVAHLRAVDDGEQPLPFGEFRLHGRLSPNPPPCGLQCPYATQERWAPLPEAQSDVAGSRRQVLLMEQVAVKPSAGMIGIGGRQAQFVGALKLPFSQCVNLQALAVGQDAEIALRVALVGDVACQFGFTFCPSRLVERSLAFEDDVAVECVGEPAAHTKCWNVLLQLNRLRLRQPRKRRAQETQEGIANGGLRSTAPPQTGEFVQILAQPIWESAHGP